MATAAQVKVSSGSELLRRHFLDNPDVSIVYASSDAAQAMMGTVTPAGPVAVVRAGEAWPEVAGPVVVDMGFTSAELGAESTAAVEAVAAVEDGGLLAQLGEDLPFLALGFVAFRGARRWVESDVDSAEIREAMFSEAKDVVINAGAGEVAATVSGLELLAAPVTIMTGLVRATLRQSATSTGLSVARMRAARRVFTSLRPRLERGVHI